MILHFISTSSNFHYLHMISVLSGLMKHTCGEVFFWAIDEPTGPYWDKVSGLVTVKHFDDPKLPALQNKSEPFKLAHLKDFMQWKILQEYGGAVLDMDTVSIRDISHWYEDREGVVASMDVQTPDDTAFPYNNAVVLAHKEAEMVKLMNRFSDALFNMPDMVWGMSGPILLSIVGLSQAWPAFSAPEHEIFNPFGGNEIFQVYQENSDLELPEKTEIIHLYAKASPMFEKVDANFVLNSKSLLARIIRDALPESDWNVKLPWDVEGYLKQRGQHYRKLFQIAGNSHIRNIMEIGTSSGQTAIGMIQVAAEQHIGLINYHGIDLFETGTPALWGKEFTGGFVPPKKADVQKILTRETFANFSLIAANSTNLTVEALCNENGWPKMDLIYIDGGHAVETVAKDWELAKGMSHDNTIVVFDDYFPEIPFIGAKVVVDAIDREQYDVQISEEVDDYNHPWGRLRTQLAIVQAKGRKKEVAVPINLIKDKQPSKPWAKDIMSRIRKSDMPNDEIYTKEYFEKINREEFHQAERLANILCNKYQPSRVVDWGCATGLYLHPFLMKGCKVLGIEKSPMAILQSPADVHISHADMTQPINLGTLKKFDLAICLEVLEHIDEEYVYTTVANIAGSSDRLILSIAGLNQPGPGHVNLKDKKYWLTKFGNHGFKLNTQATTEIVEEMKKGYHMGWLVNNMMVLERA